MNAITNFLLFFSKGNNFVIFYDTVFAVFVKGDVKVKLFCFVFKFVIVAYVEDAADDNK